MVMQASSVWAAASTALSACLYLLDLGTNISTLLSYYRYKYQCPHAPLASPLLRDPVCRALRFSHSIRFTPTIPAFWACLLFLALAHLTYAFMFWITLHPREHPLRLAYFMPLIHLYRLLMLLRHSFSSEGLKELQKSQAESSSLYSALGASLETVPLLIIQLNVAWSFGQFLNGSSDLYMQTLRLPTDLILSLVASMASGVYNASMGIWFLTKKHHVSLARRACVSTMAGCQTFVVMLAKSVLAVAMSENSNPRSIPVAIYLVFGVIVAWPCIDSLLRRHPDSRGKGRCLVAAHSLGLAFMTAFTGPIYVMVKLGGGAQYLISGTLLHIFVELIGLILVLSLPRAFRKQESPCHSSQITSTQELENKYLTCTVFLGTIFPSLFVLLLTSILFAWIHVKSGKNAAETYGENAGGTSGALEDSVCYIPKASSFNVSTLTLVDMQLSKKLEHNQWSAHNYKRLLLFVMTILFVQKIQQKHILKGFTGSY